MVKKTKKKISSFNIPAPVAIASLAVNLILLLTLVASSLLDKNGMFDHLIINSGIDKMCSKEYRKSVEKTSDDQKDTANERGLRLALIDYPCGNHDSQKFYQDGFDGYVRSLGLNPDK